MDVNIRLDSNLVDRLSVVASSKGRTLSEEIEYRLLLIPLEISEKPKKGTISSKLRGIVHLPNDFDYKKELENRKL